MAATVEEKLRLFRQLKEDANENENALQIRRSLLSDQLPSSEEYVGQGGLLSLKIRFFFAFVIFGAYLLMQYGGFSIGSVTCERIVTVISEESDTNIFDFSAFIPYTLKE